MRKILGAAMFLAATAIVASEEKKTSLDGTYVLVAVELLGVKQPEAVLKKESEEDRTIMIKGNKMIQPKDKKEMEIKMDATKTPAEIDLKETKGDKPELSYGIYKLEGDTLTICLVEDSKPADRPKEFKTDKDSKAMILTFNKKKDK